MNLVIFLLLPVLATSPDGEPPKQTNIWLKHVNSVTIQHKAPQLFKTHHKSYTNKLEVSS
jgi:hypothetical protein